MDTELMTLKEVMDRLRISRWTLYEMINDGTLHRVKVRGKALITKDSLDAYFAEILR